jgi:GxxExxY protein
MTMDINALTDRIIGCAYAVHNALGPGFLEKVYENALRLELDEAGLAVEQQQPIPVCYRGQLVGDFYADLIVAGRVIVELKAVQNVAKEHEVQLVNYLTATGIDDGLLINFGSSVDVKRKFRKYRRHDLQDEQD